MSVVPTEISSLARLPRWSDAGSVTAYLMTAFGAIVAFLALVHPGFSVPAVVPEVVPIAGSLIAVAAQAVNAARHTNAHKAVAVEQIRANAATALVANATPMPVPPA